VTATIPPSDLPHESSTIAAEKMPPCVYRPGSRPLRVAGRMLSVRSYVETRSCISVRRSLQSCVVFCRLADGRTLFPALMKGKIASSLLLAIALTLGGPAAVAQSTAQIQAEVQKALSNSKYEGVHGSVEGNGLVVLNGSVDVFDLREKIDHKVHRIKGVKAVENDIQVAGAQVPDQELSAKLVKASNTTASVMEPHRSMRSA
jgi:hypothetical protein